MTNDNFDAWVDRGLVLDTGEPAAEAWLDGAPVLSTAPEDAPEPSTAARRRVTVAFIDRGRRALQQGGIDPSLRSLWRQRPRPRRHHRRRQRHLLSGPRADLALRAGGLIRFSLLRAIAAATSTPPAAQRSRLSGPSIPPRSLKSLWTGTLPRGSVVSDARHCVK
jgi:hypothetical protein